MHNKNIIDVTQRPGFIYVMSIPSFQNVLKIGKTTRLPGYRAAQLSSSSGLPEPFKVEYSRFVERDLDAIETRIHQELAAHRICDDRKFFRLSADEAIDKIDEIIDDHMAYKFGKIIYQHRQHAKWGVFLEHIGVPFQYLPEPVHIAGNISFQAHFWLEDQDSFMFVSENFLHTQQGQMVALLIARKTRKIVVQFWACQPGVEYIGDGDIVLHTGTYLTPGGERDGAIEWNICETCGSRHFGHLGSPELCDSKNRNISKNNCQCCSPELHPKILRGYQMVRHIFDGEPL
jgi:hypothetical protein